MAVTLESDEVHVALELDAPAAPFDPFITYMDYNEAGIIGDLPTTAENFRILIDLSDTANYHHNATGFLELWKIAMVTVKSSLGSTFSVQVGVVLSVAPGNVVIAYLEPGSITYADDDPKRFTEDREFANTALSLRVASGQPADGMIFDQVTENTINQATAIKTSLPGNPTANPQVGDLMMKVTRTLGAGTVRVHPFALYQARP